MCPNLDTYLIIKILEKVLHRCGKRSDIRKSAMEECMAWRRHPSKGGGFPTGSFQKKLRNLNPWIKQQRLPRKNGTKKKQQVLVKGTIKLKG
jgi:hypothetical protein